MKTRIIVKLTFDAVHKWNDCDIKQVRFLKNEHRHNFYITAKKEVSHNDRDIEIITFKNQIKDYLGSMYYDEEIEIGNLHSMSCEMLAEELMHVFELSYVSVLEDNENGAECYE